MTCARHVELPITMSYKPTQSDTQSSSFRKPLAKNNLVSLFSAEFLLSVLSMLIGESLRLAVHFFNMRMSNEKRTLWIIVRIGDGEE